MPDAPLIVGHVSHWYHAVLYAVPVLAVLIAIAISAWRARGLEDDGDDRRDESS